MRDSVTETSAARKDKFLALVRKEMLATYEWTKCEFKLEQFMQTLTYVIRTGKDEIMLADSPVLSRCWQEVGMKCKLTAKNLKKL